MGDLVEAILGNLPHVERDHLLLQHSREFRYLGSHLAGEMGPGLGQIFYPLSDGTTGLRRPAFYCH